MLVSCITLNSELRKDATGRTRRTAEMEERPRVGVRRKGMRSDSEETSDIASSSGGNLQRQPLLNSVIGYGEATSPTRSDYRKVSLTLK